jgi:hypothetical protein
MWLLPRLSGGACRHTAGAVDSEALTERLAPLEHVRPLEADRLGSLQAERTLPAALLVVGALVVAWLLLAPDSPDLAAQVYRVRLFEHGGFALWDDNWYAGHAMPGYSLLFPWLASLLGMRLIGALAAIVSTWAFERLVVPVYGATARWAAACFALAAAGDLWIGRLTFALGVAFGVCAVLALVRKQAAFAALLATACAMSSPVAGLMLALAGVTHMLAERRLRAGLALSAPALAAVGALQALFPEGGWQPFAASSVIAVVAVTLAFLYALPPQERLLRIGALLYLATIALSLTHTPMGSNVERYGALLAAPMLVAALARRGWRSPGRSLTAVVAALGGILLWTVWGPVRESGGVASDPSTKAAYYAPLERFLASHGGAKARVEVPFTHSHWEAALLAPTVSLARGWERQLDTRYDPLFFGGALTANAYRAWLDEQAVDYVALPDVPLDTSAVAEGTLIRKGVPFLREVLHTAHWRVFAVVRPTPIASPPARLVALGHAGFALRFARSGTSLVKLHFTPYWRVVAGVGCVSAARGGWTRVRASRPGLLSVGVRFSVSSAVGLGGGDCGGPRA